MPQSTVSLPTPYTLYRLYDGLNYTVLPEGMVLAAFTPEGSATKLERAPFSTVIIRTDPGYQRAPAPLVLRGTIIQGEGDAVYDASAYEAAAARAVLIEDVRAGRSMTLRGGLAEAQEGDYGLVSLTLHLFPADGIWRDANGNEVVY